MMRSLIEETLGIAFIIFILATVVLTVFKITTMEQVIYAVECDTGFNTGPSTYTTTYDGVIGWRPVTTPDRYMSRKMHPGETCYRYRVEGTQR